MTTAADKALDIHIVEKETHIAVVSHNVVLGSFTGPKCKAHAELFRQSLQWAQEMRAELVKVRESLKLNKPFTLKPIGAPNSADRREQEEQIRAYDEALATLNRHIGDE